MGMHDIDIKLHECCICFISNLITAHNFFCESRFELSETTHTCLQPSNGLVRKINPIPASYVEIGWLYVDDGVLFRAHI